MRGELMKMKKTMHTSVMLLVFLTFFSVSTNDTFANESGDLAPNARAAILMDATTGTVLYEKNSSEQLAPASITKMMTMLLVIEAISHHTLKWTDVVTVSEHAASIGGSQIFLEPGEQMSVSDLFKGMVLASGNDAAVALAEKVAGSEPLFVQSMNNRARSLHLKNTHFSNTNGLPVNNHYSSAKDIAIIARQLVKYPEVLKVTREYEDHLRKNTDKPFWLVNTNKLIRFYKGADGLKTGYTGEAKFCVAATAKRDNIRVIAVVLGEPSSKIRNAEASKLMDYAFSQYMHKTLIHKGDIIAQIKISKGNPSTFTLKASQDYRVFAKKDEIQSGKWRSEIVINKKIVAPVKKGTVVGEVKLFNKDNTVSSYPLMIPVSIEKSTIWSTLKQLLSQLTLMK
jgi:D-alanyl-D-alanine carboxypeptidase (penicillin-binding protein 5/6)